MTEQTAVIYGRQSRGSDKSINEQIEECSADVLAQEWVIGRVYRDKVSASRYARRTRDDWPKVLADIESGSVDVLVLWESSRGDRDLETWAGLLRRCRDHKVLIRVTSHGHTYDMSKARDWRSLAEDGIDNAYESEKLSLRVRRGVAASAASGRPSSGPRPYGYLRTYDPRTGKLSGQEADPDTAPVVVEIFQRVHDGVPLSVIVADLVARGVPAPKGGQWTRYRVRYIATNPAYIGKRKHNDKLYDASWPALVDDDVFYAVQNILYAPARMADKRPGLQKHLLTGLAKCQCGKPLAARSTAYVCRDGHVYLQREALDNLVMANMFHYMTKPENFAKLAKAGASRDKAVVAANAEVEKLTGELNTWRLSAAKGNTTPESLAVIEADLSKRIHAAQQNAKAQTFPPSIRALMMRKGELTLHFLESMTLQAKRDAIRTVMTVTVKPSGQNSFLPTRDRVDIGWLKPGKK